MIPALNINGKLAPERLSIFYPLALALKPGLSIANPGREFSDQWGVFC
jgi:hypothetical protein